MERQTPTMVQVSNERTPIPTTGSSAPHRFGRALLPATPTTAPNGSATQGEPTPPPSKAATQAPIPVAAATLGHTSSSQLATTCDRLPGELPALPAEAIPGWTIPTLGQNLADTTCNRLPGELPALPAEAALPPGTLDPTTLQHFGTAFYNGLAATDAAALGNAASKTAALGLAAGNIAASTFGSAFNDAIAAAKIALAPNPNTQSPQLGSAFQPATPIDQAAPSAGPGAAPSGIPTIAPGLCATAIQAITGAFTVGGTARAAWVTASLAILGLGAAAIIRPTETDASPVNLAPFAVAGTTTQTAAQAPTAQPNQTNNTPSAAYSATPPTIRIAATQPANPTNTPTNPTLTNPTPANTDPTPAIAAATAAANSAPQTETPFTVGAAGSPLTSTTSTTSGPNSSPPGATTIGSIPFTAGTSQPFTNPAIANASTATNTQTSATLTDPNQTTAAQNSAGPDTAGPTTGNNTPTAQASSGQGNPGQGNPGQSPPAQDTSAPNTPLNAPATTLVSTDTAPTTATPLAAPDLLTPTVASPTTLPGSADGAPILLASNDLSTPVPEPTSILAMMAALTTTILTRRRL